MKVALGGLSSTLLTNVFTRSSRRARLVASLALFAIALGTLVSSASSTSLRARLLGVLMGAAAKTSRSAIVKNDVGMTALDGSTSTLSLRRSDLVSSRGGNARAAGAILAPVRDHSV